MLDPGQLEDGLHLLTGRLKVRDGGRWRQRLCGLRRLSPVANTLHLQLFKEGPRGLQSKASLSLDNFRAIETGFTLDRESNTLALLCDGNSIVLAFEAREALIQWQVKIAASVPYDVTARPTASTSWRAAPGAAGQKDCTFWGSPEGRLMSFTQRWRKLPSVDFRRGEDWRGNRTWSACSSDDCDLSDPAAAASSDVITRPCGDGQSEFSAGSSGSDSAAGRRASAGSGGGSGFGSGVCGRSVSGSGSGMRSPRAARRCSADCACAVKISRSSLRRTGVLDGVGEEPRNAINR
ncbi:Protein Dok-7 [Amphibalanus amphitrite]|uniref:Protein Dok-7 n=1 Tax=Amphibalanus amphitrite TaxID=1232801 RepID=A0A6A4WNE2_AMPAM|nr:Protein Dok-7 [Amphibalanus amphitrite]KAF0303482.1 Protein Dok-7 [Amphibalanus amphitrite]